MPSVENGEISFASINEAKRIKNELCSRRDCKLYSYCCGPDINTNTATVHVVFGVKHSDEEIRQLASCLNKKQ